MAGTFSLSIISFNDTNDLLTWHVPAWYGNTEKNADGSNSTSCQPLADIENVFVRNTWLLPILLENPVKAHNGYFGNLDVWQAIACGASRGSVNNCL